MKNSGSLTGLFLAQREAPIRPPAATGSPARAALADSPAEMRAPACNIGRLSGHQSAFWPAGSGEIQNRLDRIAEIIKAHRPDLVFLNEAVWEYGHGGIDQVRHLAGPPICPFGFPVKTTMLASPFFERRGETPFFPNGRWSH
ncbi:MAG: hypothetical protein ACLFRG_19365 [Desulfococcaceae bacterium]